jgi:integrase
MPLKPYQRGATWWAKGRVEYNGRPITGYIRESTGASDQAGARDWIQDREEQERRRYLIGEEASALTFSGAVLLYGKATPTMAKYLKPLVKELGDLRCDRITPGMIRDLGPKLYPNNCTDSWRRWVVTPARAVINNANDKGLCPPIRIKGYSEAERVEQDKRRKKASRIEQRPGDWEWLLKFRQKAPERHAALALFMFATGARIGQAVQMHPKHHLRLQEGKVIVPGAKGHADREITIPPELVAELANLKPRTPRGWDRNDKRNLRVFGFASSCGPLKSWRKACKDAKIPYIPPHAAGRHGFGQEHVVRQGTDDKAAGKYGGWRDTGLMRRTYTHAEDAEGKILAGFRTGLVQAEQRTGLKLLKSA